MKNDPYLKKQTNEWKKKKKKKERKKENSHALLSHAWKAIVLSAVPNVFYHLAGLILATTAQNWQANLPGFLRCNRIFFTHETLRCS